MRRYDRLHHGESYSGAAINNRNTPVRAPVVLIALYDAVTGKTAANIKYAIPDNLTGPNGRRAGQGRAKPAFTASSSS